jgi:hypothetical protein
MSIKVSHDQFNIEGDKLTHVPTGAQFWMGETDVVVCDWAMAGQAPEAIDFNRDELMRAAKELLESERTRCL